MIKKIVLIGLLSGFTATAAEVTTPAPQASPVVEAIPPPPHLWSAALYGGTIIGTSTNVTVRNTSGAQVGNSTSTAGQASYQFGGELVLNLPSRPDLGMGLAIEYSNYRYKDSSPPDTQIGIYALPRAQAQSGDLHFWAAVAVGLGITSFGQESAILDGVTFRVPKGAFGFAVSPRVGIDLTRSFGAQVGYFTNSADVDASATNNGTTTHFSLNGVRSWWMLNLRYNL